MERPGRTCAPSWRFVAVAERLNLACARLGTPCVYDTARLPWAASIEREWRVVRRELDA
jgi:aspartyl/asparaginyl beta-hydroxylase (cupin superfamily)